jgi:single-stranded DNA-binding protein
MLSVLVSGSLVRDPQRRTAQNGKAFATALMRCPSEEADALLISVISFTAPAVKALLALKAGDSLAVTGRAKLSSWTKDGEERHGLSVTADAVLSLYEVAKRRKQAQEAGEPT